MGSDRELIAEIDACRRLAAGLVRSEVGDVDALQRRVDADVDAELGPIAQLRAMRTGRRIAVVAGLALAVTAAALIFRPRPDLAAYPVGWMMVIIASLVALTSASAWRLLRPLQAPPPSLWSSRALLVAGVLAPCLIALVPAHVGSDPGAGTAFVLSCGQCMAFGAVLGLPVLTVALLARRSRVDGAAVAALAGVAAGLTGNLSLQVHCPISDVAHLLLGHAPLLLVLAVVAALWHR